MKRIGLFSILTFLLLGFLARPTLADQSNSFVTIVNPVRLSTYNQDPEASLRSEYSEVNQRSLPATWLLTDDVLNNPGLVKTVKSFNQDQELGIFLEVSPALALRAQVDYPKSAQWYFANAIFLSGYSQVDRKKIVDMVFNDFKNTFGFYPKTVGSWWTDSYSLDYIHQKYQVVANLGLADQYSTDRYQVWGSYWSTPFYPTLWNTAIPASSSNNKLNVVNLEWAPRDPLNGYGSTLASSYSSQDYNTIGLNDDYFGKLVNLYGLANSNDFGQITVGLEADLSPDVYHKTFAHQLDLISKLSTNQIQVVPASKFANWYQQTFPDLSPAQIIVSQDLLSSNKKAIWYQSPNYRLGLTYDPATSQTKVIDFRTYQNDIEDPYYLVPNGQMDLHINLPSLIDSVTVPGDAWTVFKSPLVAVNQKDQTLELSYQDQSSITFSNDQIVIKNQDLNQLPKTISSGKTVTVSSHDHTVFITPKADWIVPKDGYIYQSLLPELPLFLHQRRGIFLLIIVGSILILGHLILIVKLKPKKIKYTFLSYSIVLLLSIPMVWIISHNRQFLVSQGEVDGLFRLSQMPKGLTLVYDHECLNCGWQTAHKPAIYANKRDYVSQLTDNPIVYNKVVFETKSRQEGKTILTNLKVKYIYLAKFDKYDEQLPFSPGDYDVEKIFENANCQIWKVKDL